jgi:AraC-like DNA-binding protein
VTFGDKKLTAHANELLTEAKLVNTDATIQAKAVEKIAKAALPRGVTPQELYGAVGFDPAVLTNPDHRIPFAQVVSLYEQGAALTGDDAFGLHLGEADPKAFDVLGYSVINSPTFGEALDRVVRYNFIWTNGSSFAIHKTGASARITYLYLDPTITEHRHDAEMTFAAIAALGRAVTAVDWFPQSVSFQHREPRDISEHQRIFGCQVRFGAPDNELVFDSAVLRLPIIKADPGLCAVLDRHAEELLAKYPREDRLIDRLRKIIRDELNGGDAGLEHVATQLGMSARTLQRKLREQNASHQEVLDQMRRDLAMRYLREPEMAICEVAYLLGFSESSALHRAFKRWTGMTPSEFRRQ